MSETGFIRGLRELVSPVLLLAPEKDARLDPLLFRLRLNPPSSDDTTELRPESKNPTVISRVLLVCIDPVEVAEGVLPLWPSIVGIFTTGLSDAENVSGRLVGL